MAASWRRAVHRRARETGNQVHTILCCLADLFAVAVALHHRAVSRTVEDHELFADQGWESGVRAGRLSIPKAPSLPRAFHDAGYKTAHFGKWHLGGGRDVTDAPKFAAYGYDEHAGTYESPEPDPEITATNWIWSDIDKFKRWQRSQFFADHTLDFLSRHKGAPCFVNVWLDDPHTPWVPDATAPKGDTPANLKGVLIEMDKQVGRLLDGLDKLGVANDTIVIFASDNGPLPTFRGGRAGLRGAKLSLYEGGLRVPFIVRWPGHTPAGRVDEKTVIGGVDLFPTLCALCKVVPPAGYQSDGEDRSAAILGQPIATRAKPLFWEYGRNNKSFAYPGIARDRSPNVAVREAIGSCSSTPMGAGWNSTIWRPMPKRKRTSPPIIPRWPTIGEDVSRLAAVAAVIGERRPGSFSMNANSQRRPP